MKQHHRTATLQYCTRCVASENRPQSRPEHLNVPGQQPKTLHIDAEGVCDACRAVEAESTIDWAERRRQLQALCDAHRSTDGSFDCVVPGSGGKDSLRQSTILREEFGMHPLCVTWPPNLMTPAGQRNFDNWCEREHVVVYKPKGSVHRLLTQLATRNLGHPFQPFIFGQKAIGPRAAKDFGIDLVFYGENEARHGNDASGNTTSLRNRDIWTYAGDVGGLSFGGVKVAELISDYGLTMNDLNFYLPLKDPGSIAVHYLGWFLPWGVRQSYEFALTRGYRPADERVSGTFQGWNSIDDWLDEAHYHLSALKGFGGRATHNACVEVREGRMTRDAALKMVERFEFEEPKHLHEILDYLDMTYEEWYSLCESFSAPQHHTLQIDDAVIEGFVR